MWYDLNLAKWNEAMLVKIDGENLAKSLKLKLV